MASLKGKKRKTAHCSPNGNEGRSNLQKQRKIEGFCKPLQTPVGQASSPLSLPDSRGALALFGDSPLGVWEFQAEESQPGRQLGGLRTPPRSWMINDSAILGELTPGQDKDLESEFHNLNHSDLTTRDFISRHSMLTSQTVLAIFDQFAEVRSKLESVTNFIAAAQTKKPQVHSIGCQTERPGQTPATVQPRERASGQHIDCKHGKNKRDGDQVGSEIPRYRSGWGNRRLVKEQIVLNIYNSKINVGRWSSKGQIVTSLSQLTRCDKGAVDLAAYEHLPQRENYLRILFKFKQQLFPSLLMRMRGFLAYYQIIPTRVFTSDEVSPLIQRAPRDRVVVQGTAVWESGLNRESRPTKEGGRSRVTEEMSARVLDQTEVNLPSIGLAQDETFDSACLETFSLLSSMEQQEVLKKLKETRKLLKQTISSAAPLASIAQPPSRHDAVPESQQSINPESLMPSSTQHKAPETVDLTTQSVVGLTSETEGIQEGTPQSPLAAKMASRNDTNAAPQAKTFTVEAEINIAHGSVSPKVTGRAMTPKQSSIEPRRSNGCVCANEGGGVGEITQEA